MDKKALLFINGLPPKDLPLNLSSYLVVLCTDGAYHYAQHLQIPIDYITGDFDSLKIEEITEQEIAIIYTPNQNKTDFEKSLDFIQELGITHIDVLGATGQEHDHFLGNLSTALSKKEELSIIFYDEYSHFFFAENSLTLTAVKGKTISLLPFFEAKNIETEGLEYPLLNEDLYFGKRIGTRNKAIQDTVTLRFTEGNLLVFVEK